MRISNQNSKIFLYRKTFSCLEMNICKLALGLLNVGKK